MRKERRERGERRERREERGTFESLERESSTFCWIIGKKRASAS
jgi:hypothetical protein